MFISYYLFGIDFLSSDLFRLFPKIPRSKHCRCVGVNGVPEECVQHSWPQSPVEWAEVNRSGQHHRLLPSRHQRKQLSVSAQPVENCAKRRLPQQVQL